MVLKLISNNATQSHTCKATQILCAKASLLIILTSFGINVSKWSFWDASKCIVNVVHLSLTHTSLIRFYPPLSVDCGGVGSCTSSPRET